MSNSFSSFIPPTRVLMGPGPSDVYPQVLEALARPTIGHLDPKFVDLMDEVKQLLSCPIMKSIFLAISTYMWLPSLTLLSPK